MAAASLDLQPMSVGDILDRTVRLYRRHFLHTLGIVSLPYLIFLPAGAVLGFGIGGQGAWRTLLNPAAIAWILLLFLAGVWLYFVSMGALARSVSERYLGGTPTIWTAYAPVFRRGLSIFWAYLLASVVGGGMFASGAILFVAVAAMALSQKLPTAMGYTVAAILGIVAVVAIFFGVRIFLRSLMVTHVIVIEDIRGWAALKRSWKLMRPSVGRAAVILVFGVVVGFVIGFALEVPAHMLLVLSPGRATAILRTVMSQLGQILSAPFVSIAFTLLYYDSRIRQEAFDLDMMAQNLGVSQGAAAPPAAAAAARPQAASPAPPTTAPVSRPWPALAGPIPGRSPAVSAAPGRPVIAMKTCPQCGTQVPPIRPNCPSCGVRVPFRSSRGSMP